MLVGLNKAPVPQPRQDQSIKAPVPSPFHNRGPSSEASVDVLAQSLSHTMAEIHRRGWCDGTGGNFSCVLRRDPLELLMAPSGVDKGSVRPGDLIVVDGSGAVIRGEGKASAETLMHLAIVQYCNAGAVLHSHSQAGTLLSQWALSKGGLELSNLEMLKGLEGIKSHATSVLLPVLTNNQNLAELSAAAAPLLPGAPKGILIAGHGLYAWGENLFQAKRHLEIIEFLLEQKWRQLILEGLGIKP
jgi:methylthioribulose-1-phosphate dehydratase